MKTIRRMMISCKKAGSLVEKKLAGEISFKERLQLMFHVNMCEACRQYEKQSTLIQKTLDQINETPLYKASTQLKDKIRENFR